MFEEVFDRYCGLDEVHDGQRYEVRTRRVVIDDETLRATATLVEPFFDSARPLLLVCDRHTWEAAGEATVASFAAADRALDRLLVLAHGDGGDAVTDDASIDHVRQALHDGEYGGALAVGAGTVNDITKMATFQLGLDYAAVATAPSMNGYTSAIAAILSDGVKTTQRCHAPVAVLCDLGVMAAAPYRMVASGLGDLLSKPVSNADWRLAARLTGATYSTFPMRMIDAASRALEGVAPGLAARDHAALGGLCAALCLSGMAMASAGTSAPASGGEHLISHYLDMVAIAQRLPHDLHGCQVGVGTITTAALYEQLRALDPLELDVERAIAQHLPWSVYQRTLAQRFDAHGLTDAVIAHAERVYPSRETLRARLMTLRVDWDDVLEDVSQTLQTAAAIRQTLIDADAPHTYAAIGVGPAQARRAVLHCKDIRARYTILHLASELGLLERWTDAALDPDAGLLR